MEQKNRYLALHTKENIWHKFDTVLTGEKQACVFRDARCRI